MGRNLDPVCKQCRREGMKLYLKGTRCESQKCPITREHPAPGMHGTKRTKLSEYGLRLREKQKLKRFYGLLERQFQRFFSLATRSPENTGEKLLTLLERRLDNVVHRLGFAPSRPSARQLVAHGHILVNGRVCNIPSRLLKLGDTVSVRNRKVSLDVVRVRMLDRRESIPDFLDLLEEEVPTGKVIREPSRADVDPRIKEIREQLIIEVARR